MFNDGRGSLFNEIVTRLGVPHLVGRGYLKLGPIRRECAMNPNTEAIRFVADAIEVYTEYFNQNQYGNAMDKNKAAGKGIEECGTPACVAGFTIQFLGDPKKLKKYKKSLNDDQQGKAMSNYARDLLGLDDKWATRMFKNSSWPNHWFGDAGVKMRPELIGSENSNVPRATSAIHVLRKLADQFESGVGDDREARRVIINQRAKELKE